MDFKRLHIRAIRWVSKNIAGQQLILLLSLLVGIFSGFAAVLLKNMIYFMGHILTEHLDISSVSILYFVCPFIGIVLTVLFLKFVVHEEKLQGITRILYAISKKNGRLKPHDMYSPLVASTLTVGLGGSVGLESPIVLSGSAIGSNIANWLRLNYQTTKLLIGCGAAGATAGIFSAPVAAVLFALEILMLDLTTGSIIPLLISAASGTAVSWLLLRDGVTFHFTVMDPLVIHNLPYYALLGIVTGLISIYFVRGTKKIEYWMDRFGKISFRWDREKKRFIGQELAGKKILAFQRLAIGGSILGILIFLFPPLWGEGYDALKMIMSGHSADLVNSSVFFLMKGNKYWLLVFLALVMVLKVIAMAVTTGSGGVGGIFAPSLFMGGLSGYIVSSIFNMIPFCSVSSNNFVLAGMAGVMAGVMHAPLTAIFLITETTGGYGLFLPISITAAFAFIMSRYIEPHTIYTSRLAQRGELITHNKDKAVLTLLKTNKLIEKDFKIMHPEQTLGDLVKYFAHSKRNIFPVVDQDAAFIGIVLLDNIRHIIFQPDRYDDTYISQLMTPAPGLIEVNASMEQVMELFEKTGAWNLPVTENGKYVGFLSKSKIFSAYRNLLQEFYED